MEDRQQYPTKDSLDLVTKVKYTFTYISGDKFDGNFEKYSMFNDDLVKGLYISKCVGCNNGPDEETGLFYIPIEDINNIQFADIRPSNNEDIILKGGKRRKSRSKKVKRKRNKRRTRRSKRRTRRSRKH
jgi:hypothetical protein